MKNTHLNIKYYKNLYKLIMTKSDLNKIGDLSDILPELLKNPVKYANNTSITKLVDILKKLSYHYYNTDEELVSDEIYDILREILEKRSPKNKYLNEIGAPIKKGKVTLPYYMASLNKIKPDTDALKVWKEKYKGPYVISDKLDGVSAMYIKTRNGEDKLYTRGNGSMGQDISYLIPYVITAHKVDIKDIPIDTAIRGELIISKKNFKKIEDEFKNARNAVAGLVNSKNYSQKVAKITEFLAYVVVNPQYKYKEQMELLLNLGFRTVHHSIKKNITNDSLSELLTTRREKSTYEIDGLVVGDSSKIYDHPNENPSYAFAFKKVMSDQVAEVTVLDVEWNATMHGYLKPRVEITPVKLVGVEITYATAFNAKFVVDNNLGPGARIKLIRSGDVIPHILAVLSPSSSGKPKLPDIPYKWNKSKVDFIVKNNAKNNTDVTIKKITHFFQILGVQFISEGIVAKLVNNDYDTIEKIITADKEDLYNIEGLGETIVDKIYKNIDTALKKAKLHELMAGSTIFGRGFGRRKLKVITNEYPNIMNEDWDNEELYEKILKLEGYSDITARQFANNFDEFKKFYKKLVKTKKIKTKVVKSKKGIFDGMKIVFTGFRNKEWENKIETDGGKVTSSVSKNTTLVVYGDNSGSKYKKAEELKIKLMSKEEFKEKYNL